ncbi:MAG TPA: response regulator [Kofleriaceae bacterium]|nr:response regulator [Kofleriaceae bacterium]
MPPAPRIPRSHPDRTAHATNRILLADPSAPARGWLGRALSRIGQRVIEVGSGIDALETLADTPIDLVIASARLDDVPGHHLLAMMRAAGSEVPLVLIHPFPSDSVRALVRRVPPAALVEDWTDTTMLRSVAARLLLELDGGAERRAV